jgi:hypothetical protein
MKVLTDDATEFNAWMCVPFPLLGSMLHTPMLAFGYLCFTFSTHVVTLTIIVQYHFYTVLHHLYQDSILHYRHFHYQLVVSVHSKQCTKQSTLQIK